MGPNAYPLIFMTAYKNKTKTKCIPPCNESNFIYTGANYINREYSIPVSQRGTRLVPTIERNALQFAPIEIYFSSQSVCQSVIQ